MCTNLYFRIHELEERLNNKDVSYVKLDTDLRHTQSVVNILQTNLDKSNEECKRLERDWEAYKNRVKSMLAAKDKEIKALQQGITLTEDTKVLVEQIDNLKWVNIIFKYKKNLIVCNNIEKAL